jgi:enamine deaminase RidA (YjgF/YER057c/UK114 family)
MSSAPIHIRRIETTPRLSRVVVYNGVVYVAGLTALNCDGDAKAQTEDILEQLDQYLQMANTDRTQLLTVQIWVADMARDFDLMNQAWETWLPAAAAPARATCQATLATPAVRVEIIATAAHP